MFKFWLQLCVSALVFQAATSQSCSNDTCATFFNRTCSANDDCTGPCLVNYTDFGDRTESCFAISDITWDRFVGQFDPEFVEDLTIVERLELLIKVAIFISQFNANNPNVTLALNKFSADAPEDAKALRGYINVDGAEDMLEPQDMSLVVGADGSDDFPTKRDWVEMGAVTSVKDQGRCGCCWAISLCGALEGAAAINSDFSYLQSISFQQFNSCDDENYGCNGGNIVVGMVYAAETNERGGIARLNDYPYSDYGGDTTEECNPEPERAVETNDGRVIVTFTDGRDFNERMERMKYALSFQPISMVIKSTCSLFNNYRSGIVTDDQDCRCEDVECIDHAVLLVGYNDEDDIPYWKIKNSWGAGWGEDGYMRVAQASNGREWGLFGMLSQGVVALDVQNVTGQVYDEPQTASSSLTGWQIALIAIAGALVAILCCCCVMTAAKKK